jgi:hypothetical protein
MHVMVAGCSIGGGVVGGVGSDVGGGVGGGNGGGGGVCHRPWHYGGKYSSLNVAFC